MVSFNFWFFDFISLAARMRVGFYVQGLFCSLADYLSSDSGLEFPVLKNAQSIRNLHERWRIVVVNFWSLFLLKVDLIRNLNA